MPPPLSSAHALHSILDSVNAQVAANSSVYHAWQKVAGVRLETSKFAAFHAEVGALLNEVLETVRALPQADAGLYTPAEHAWWWAVTRPRADWHTIKDELLDQRDLALLGALAHVVEARRVAVAGPPHASEVDVLHKGVLLILGQVESADDLPAAVRDQIEADLRHVQWLLENVDTFGVQHAREAAEAVSGRVTAAAAKDRSPRLRRCAVGLAAVLVVASGPAADLAVVTESVAGVFGLGEESQSDDATPTVTLEVVQEVYNACTPKALESGPSKDRDDETEDGRAATSDEEDILDGESVEDEDDR